MCPTCVIGEFSQFGGMDLYCFDWIWSHSLQSAHPILYQVSPSIKHGIIYWFKYLIVLGILSVDAGSQWKVIGHHPKIPTIPLWKFRFLAQEVVEWNWERKALCTDVPHLV